MNNLRRNFQIMNNINDFLKKFEMNFKNLQTVVPLNIEEKKGVSFDLISDNLVKSMDPKKYDFYIQYISQIGNDPEKFKKVLYEYKLVKNKKEKIEKLINDIEKQYNKIFAVTDKQALDDIELYSEIKKGKKQNEGNKMNEFEDNLISQYYDIDKDKDKDKYKIFEKQEIDKTQGASGGSGEAIQKENDVIQNLQAKKMKYLDNINQMKDIYEDNQILSKYNDKIDAVNNNATNDYDKATMMKNVIDEIEDEDNMYSIHKFKVSKEDKLIFIGITFLIRLLSLSLIDWSLKTNLVVTFTDAFLLYVFLYTIFIILMIVIVNISYNMPLSELYTGDSTILSQLGSTLYYFYLIPGNRLQSLGKIFFHLGLLYFVTIVSIIIKQTKRPNYDQKQDKNERYDYSFKRDIRNTLNSFTLIAWLFLSFLVII